MAEQPPWRAIQPPKLPRFTGEADGCDADEFIQEAERILRNFRMEEGTAVEWLIQALVGSARREVLTRAAGEADTAAQVLAPKVVARTAKTWAAVSASPAARVSTSLRADPTNKEVEELRGLVAALTKKTAELQAELRHQSTRAPRPKVCYWCEQPGHFQQDCAERRQYVQWQQGPRASFSPNRPQPRFYARRHSAGPRFPSHQGN